MMIENHPLIAATLARNITDEQVADVIRAINEQGKGRTANKARSTIRAAFTLANKAKTCPKLPLALKGFNIKSNPAATVGDLARSAVGDAIELFTMKRLRSGVETMLSKAGVSREVRGQLQSHGLNGVQLGSYDA